MTCGKVYGISGCDKAQEALLAHGYPKLPLSEVHVPSSPSEVEAAAILAEVSRIGAGSVIILANPLESRRLNRIYRKDGKKRRIRIEVVSVSDRDFDPGDWWRLREGAQARCLRTLPVGGDSPTALK
jgi:hypothetical protein